MSIPSELSSRHEAAVKLGRTLYASPLPETVGWALLAQGAEELLQVELEVGAEGEPHDLLGAHGLAVSDPRAAVERCHVGAADEVERPPVVRLDHPDDLRDGQLGH